MYLGTRPQGFSPGFHVLGRETFLAGVTWVDGWPVFDEARYGVPVPDTDFVDEFSAPGLDHRWVTPYTEPETVAQHVHPSGLVLASAGDGRVGLLCTRVRNHYWIVEAMVEGGGRFLIRLDERHWYGLHFENGTVRVAAQIGDLRQVLRSHDVKQKRVTMRIASVPPRPEPTPSGLGGPDDIILSVDDHRGQHHLARIDGRYLSTEVATGFTSRMLAIGSGGSRSCDPR